MPENWKTYKLGEVADLATGFAFKSKFYENTGNTRVVRGINVTEGFLRWNSDARYWNHSIDKLEKYNVEVDDIVIGMDGSKVGKNRAITRNHDLPAILAQRVARIRAKKGIACQKYIWQLINNTPFENYVENIKTGTSIPHISLGQINNFEIVLPPLPEQTAIASILSALDDKIELNLQMNKTLEEMAMTLYKHWFVDFGPFQNGKFIDSELGMIPEGWEVKTLEEILKIKHGYAFKGEYFTTDENENLLLTPGNFEMQGGIKFNWGKQKFYSGEFPIDYILKKGDLIIALTDLTQSCDILGASALIPDEDYLYLHNQRLGLVTDLSPSLSKELIYCITNSAAFRAFIRNSKTGSTVSHTSPSRIYDYKIALPFERISEKLAEQLFALNEQKTSNLSENKLLVKTRDTLLPKLISGEVRVKDIENQVAAIL